MLAGKRQADKRAASTGNAALMRTGTILCAAVAAKTWVDERISMVFSRITVVIIVGKLVQYVIDSLGIIGFVSLYRLTSCRHAL